MCLKESPQVNVEVEDIHQLSFSWNFFHMKLQNISLKNNNILVYEKWVGESKIYKPTVGSFISICTRIAATSATSYDLSPMSSHIANFIAADWSLIRIGSTPGESSNSRSLPNWTHLNWGTKKIQTKNFCYIFFFILILNIILLHSCAEKTETEVTDY